LNNFTDDFIYHRVEALGMFNDVIPFLDTTLLLRLVTFAMMNYFLSTRLDTCAMMNYCLFAMLTEAGHMCNDVLFFIYMCNDVLFFIYMCKEMASIFAVACNIY
jgi:hypothetical protein